MMMAHCRQPHGASGMVVASRTDDVMQRNANAMSSNGSSKQVLPRSNRCCCTKRRKGEGERRSRKEAARELTTTSEWFAPCLLPGCSRRRGGEG